jgi:penicillin-binding protein 1A
MRDVIRRGTGVRARQLGRNDIAGKTGTTNDQRDAWFAGFNPNMVTVAWVGFDDTHPLGSAETGGRAALPMWIDFMRAALQGIPDHPSELPPGLVTVRIDPDTGLLADSKDRKAIFEIFLADHVPTRESGTAAGETGSSPEGTSAVPEQLF